MATVDARGRRKGNSDPRVSEAAKAEMPAYGFEGLTVGEIDMLRRERLNREAAEGKKRLTTDDKKY
jgi:hypothetical protein